MFSQPGAPDIEQEGHIRDAAPLPQVHNHYFLYIFIAIFLKVKCKERILLITQSTEDAYISK